MNPIIEFGDRCFNNGKQKGLEDSIEKLANYFIEQSKIQGKLITKDEAQQKARTILTE